MTVFIVLAALLAALAIASLAWPLVRPRPDQAGRSVAPSKAAAGALAVAVPLLAFGLYFAWSDWDWGGAVADADHASDPAGSMAQMAGQLEARLMREQGDAEGWKLLGRTWVVSGNYPKAVEAYRQAYTLTGGKDVDALLGYAEARVLVNESDFEGEAGQLFEQAVAAEATDPRALWYSGVAAYRRDDLATARNRWAALKELGAPPEIVEIIDARIAEIDRSLGASSAPAQPAVASAAPPAATATPAAPPSGVSEATAAGGIPLRVSITPELAGRVPPGATIFIFANNPAGGPPLAAVRRQGGQLPLDVTLSDSDAMIAGTSLAQTDALRLVARVSMTGRPIAAAGDLFGEVRYDPRSKGRVTLTIDRIVE